MGRRRGNERELVATKGRLHVCVSFHRACFGCGVTYAFYPFSYYYYSLSALFLELDRCATGFRACSRGRLRYAVEVGGPRGETGVVVVIFCVLGCFRVLYVVRVKVGRGFVYGLGVVS